MANILVVYGAKSYPLRATTQDHLYCFRRYSGQRCFYFNMLMPRKPWYRKVPSFLRQISFDVIIFYLDLLNIQWPPYSIDSFMKQGEYFRGLQAVKVALAQDEFYNTDSLDCFVREYKIDHVFSLAAEPEWSKIYPGVDFNKVRFHRVLPGYLDEKRVEQINQMADLIDNRPYAIGYRAIRQQNQHWLGRHGYKKVEIAEVFEEGAKEFNLLTDISTRAEDALLGNEWLKFLLRCRYTIAVEGGASVLDHDGSVRERTETYLAKKPGANFDEVEKACFPGRDGELNYMAISPKHLEACATRTCQILVEGDYNGILIPDVHYIELKRDFSNIDQVLQAVKEDRIRSTITQRAYSDIVTSGRFTYRYFVASVLQDSIGLHVDPIILQSRKPLDDWKHGKLYTRFAYGLSYLFECIQWIEVAFLTSSVQLIRRRFPESVELVLRKWMS